MEDFLCCYDKYIVFIETNIYEFNECFNLTYFTPFSGVSIVEFQQ